MNNIIRKGAMVAVVGCLLSPLSFAGPDWGLTGATLNKFKASLTKTQPQYVKGVDSAERYRVLERLNTYGVGQGKKPAELLADRSTKAYHRSDRNI